MRFHAGPVYQREAAPVLRTSAQVDVLKGHDFSRADNARKISPEESSLTMKSCAPFIAVFSR
jgi:hypothetical protein